MSRRIDICLGKQESTCVCLSYPRGGHGISFRDRTDTSVEIAVHCRDLEAAEALQQVIAKVVGRFQTDRLRDHMAAAEHVPAKSSSLLVGVDPARGDSYTRVTQVGLSETSGCSDRLYVLGMDGESTADVALLGTPYPAYPNACPTAVSLVNDSVAQADRLVKLGDLAAASAPVAGTPSLSEAQSWWRDRPALRVPDGAAWGSISLGVSSHTVATIDKDGIMRFCVEANDAHAAEFVSCIESYLNRRITGLSVQAVQPEDVSRGADDAISENVESMQPVASRRSGSATTCCGGTCRSTGGTGSKGHGGPERPAGST